MGSRGWNIHDKRRHAINWSLSQGGHLAINPLLDHPRQDILNIFTFLLYYCYYYYFDIDVAPLSLTTTEWVVAKYTKYTYKVGALICPLQAIRFPPTTATPPSFTTNIHWSLILLARCRCGCCENSMKTRQDMVAGGCREWAQFRNHDNGAVGCA